MKSMNCFLVSPRWTALICGLLAHSAVCRADLLDKIDDALFWQSPQGAVRLDLSGLLDAELYYIDQRPPGLLFSDDQFFFNPRLSLFLDAKLGKHFYGMVQARADRGFDPGVDLDGEVRLDEYLLRYLPWGDARFNFQVGKFATVVGNWVPRHDSWNNPLINAPLPYENVIVISDLAAPPGAPAMLDRKNVTDLKRNWLPLLWGPVYAAGASAFGRLDKFDYAVEMKNGSISSRPYGWDPTIVGWDYPTFSARAGYRPNAAWNLGISGSYGTYLLPFADPTLPDHRSLNDYNQITVAWDVGYARHHWQFWGELFLSRFQVPNVGNADTAAYYLEAKYKINSRWFLAARWNQQLFAEIDNATGGQEPWDRDIWRIEGGIGYRHNRHLQAKLQYTYNHEAGGRQQGEQLAAAQFTLKF